MVLILKNKSSKSPRQQIEKAISSGKNSVKKHAWSKFFGKLKSLENPVEYQRQLRDE